MIKFPWRRNQVRMFPDGPRRLTLIEPTSFFAERWEWVPWPSAAQGPLRMVLCKKPGCRISQDVHP